MNLDRNTTLYIHRVLDALPPALRDCRWMWALVFRAFFGKKGAYFMDFKTRSVFVDPKEYNRYYLELGDAHIQRPTDLNNGSIATILRGVEGTTLLDAGCGRGFLCEAIAKAHPNIEITGCDIVIDGLRAPPGRRITYIAGNVESLPFSDGQFQTVVCTHTLEHVRNVSLAISELRRVCSRRLICVFPRQREYPYTFDLHLNFFPYKFSVDRVFQNPRAQVSLVEGDWVVSEDRASK